MRPTAGLHRPTLSAAALVAILAILRPLKYLDYEESQIDELSDHPLLTTAPEVIRERRLITETKAVVDDRKVNTRKARRSTAASILLAVGLIGVAGQAITLGVASDAG